MIRPAVCLAPALAIAGCLSTPLGDREWVEVRTAHYDVWSSLGREASQQLAVDLEHFRTAAAFIAGREIPADAVTTRVYAFDDRGIGRPFAYQSQRAYLLSRQPGDVIVLRTGGGWEGDAWTPVKLQYARRLLWNASPDALPPWLDEGLPQLASTLESRSDGAVAGVPPRPHVKTLRESHWIPFDRLFGADLSGWSGLERQTLEAESWALCHYLTFSGNPGLIADSALTRYRARIREGMPPDAAARSEFGDLAELQHDVFRVIRGADLTEGQLRIRWPGPAPTVRDVSRREVFEQLGELALAIGEGKLAEGFLEDAQEQGAGSVGLFASWGDLLESRGDSDGADSRYEAALAASPDDPRVHLRYANLLRARAANGDLAQRSELANRAREHYARSVELSGELELGEAHAGLAATYLVDGADPNGSLAHARAARQLLPGDAEIGLLAAKLELAAGDREAARRDATLEANRARSASDLEAARSVLARIDERVSIR
jgi:tetratricopeptide (TPR) repeat protein